MENINSRLELAEESENQKKGYLKLSKQRKRKESDSFVSKVHFEPKRTG